jgi:hypothetical protein
VKSDPKRREAKDKRAKRRGERAKMQRSKEMWTGATVARGEEGALKAPAFPSSTQDLLQDTDDTI